MLIITHGQILTLKQGVLIGGLGSTTMYQTVLGVTAMHAIKVTRCDLTGKTASSSYVVNHGNCAGL